jgi:hypothetical protein
MTITVGTDTYATVAEADAYLANFYVSTDVQLVAWDALSDGDKEIYLRNATRSLERLFFIGRKYADNQTLSFPREVPQPFPNRRWEGNEITVRLTLGEEYDPSYSPYYLGNGNIPDAIKYAQIEEALELASPSAATTKQQKMSGHIKSASIGHFSESYITRNSAGNTPQTVLRSVKAQEYIQPFVNGGFRVV